MAETNIQYEKIKKFFEKLAHYIIVLNKTSQTQILYPNSIKIENFELNSLTLKMPARSCSKGHLLYLFITTEENVFKDLKKIPDEGRISNSITIKCKVSSVFLFDKHTNEVKINFIDFSQQDWQAFLAKYEERNQLINKIIHDMKK